MNTIDFIGPIETWVEEHKWERTKGMLPKGFKWETTHATRDNTNGRAKRGVITGIREELMEEKPTKISYCIHE